MIFYPHDIFGAYRAERVVWEKAKLAFRDDIGVAFHSYQIFSINGNLEREIDIFELPGLDSTEPDEYLEADAQPDGEDGKSGKVAESHRRTQVKKKHYTEDSIRLYLQEIGRIRLLRADEEIELARKIADLMELERVYQRLCEQLDREPHDSEWAEAVKLPLSSFRYRLHIGRRAKDKMVSLTCALWSRSPRST